VVQLGWQRLCGACTALTGHCCEKQSLQDMDSIKLQSVIHVYVAAPRTAPQSDCKCISHLPASTFSDKHAAEALNTMNP
jgi:hypothetical protein